MPRLEEVAICQRDLNGMVQYQNESSKAGCGNRVGHVCKSGCYGTPNVFTTWDRGLKTARTKDHREIAHYVDKAGSTTVIFPPTETEFDFQSYRFTKRETQIAQLMVAGMTNAEIKRKLSISLATLRTHINNIYGKLPADAKTRLRAHEPI